MAANYVLLEKITVGAATASSVTFSSIPQTGYTDLFIKTSVRSVGTGGSGWDDYLNIRFNGDSGNNYGEKYLQGYAGAVQSGGTATRNKILAGLGNGSTSTANTFAVNEMYIPNYAGSTYKSLSIEGLLENSSTSDYITRVIAPIWNNTAAITSINLFLDGANIAQYSTFYLYGVAKLGTTPAISPYATGGDTIMTDGTYWYHTFVSSGTFTPQKSLSCDYLVVAGGGSGSGSYGGGGGGAGAFRTSVGGSPLSLPSGTGVTVTVGAGGAGTVGQGVNGSNSVFSTITSTGGGGGAIFSPNGGLNGGSGGGGSNNGTGGTGTTGGNNGGNGGQFTPGGFPTGGGGGGSSAVGVTATLTGGAGGAGTASSLSGSSVTYAGGGGGGVDSRVVSGAGAGGAGGGGAGSNLGNGTAGTANTGGGGGGAGVGITGTGGSGGSGIVLVRYAV